MKTGFRLFFSVIVFILYSFSINATEKRTFTIDGIYKHFAYHYSPKDLFINLQRAALWLSIQGEKGLPKFNEHNTQFQIYDGDHPFIMVMNCSNGTVLTHPNSVNRKVVANKPDLLKIAKDHSGKLHAVEACTKVKSQPKGAWISTYSTWMKTLTGLGPIYMAMATVKVPDTEYEVVSWLPWKANSIEEVDLVVEDLNNLVEEWSIIK